MWFKLQVLCRRKIHPEDHSLQPEEPYDVVQSLQPLLKVLDAIVLKANQSYEVRADHGTGNEFGIYISLLKGCHIKFTAYPSKRNNIKKPSVKAFVVAILWFALGIILSVWTELNWHYINNLKTLIMVVVVKKQFPVLASLRWMSGYYACWEIVIKLRMTRAEARFSGFGSSFSPNRWVMSFLMQSWEDTIIEAEELTVGVTSR